jgi:presenilin-like A22 family membrane protease
MPSTRKLENFHILLWLLKDMSWLMMWRGLGIFMIIPTIGFAILITYKSRQNKSDLFHNLAIICWIIANSFWMLTEFFDLANYRFYAAIPFSIGLAIILFYYLKNYFFKQNAKAKL